MILPPTLLNTKNSKFPEKNSAAAVPTYEAKYNDKDSNGSNDESELASGSQYDEFDDVNSVNINRSILCDVSIGDKAVQNICEEIEISYHNSVDDGGLMESADLGFEFHENFAPVGLIAGDAVASRVTDESIALVECLR